MMKVERLLQEKGNTVLSFHKDTSILEAADKFGSTIEGKRFSVSVVVDDDRRVLGVLSLGDIVHGISTYKADVVNQSVGTLMTPNVYAAQLSDTLLDVLKNMVEHQVRHVPVVKDGVLQGLVARKDVLETLHGDALFQLTNLTEYVYRSGGRY